MMAVLKPEARRYVKQTPRRYFTNGAEREDICYSTFVKALKLEPVKIETAYAALVVLDVPEESQVDLVELLWDKEKIEEMRKEVKI